MSVKNLFVQAPYLCGASHAGKHAKMAEIVWKHEQEKNGFQRQEDESAFDRIAFLFDWDCSDFGKRSYCINLAHLCVLAHYGAEHGDDESAKEAKVLADSLDISEALYPDVAAVLTVESATKGFWGS